MGGALLSCWFEDLRRGLPILAFSTGTVLLSQIIVRHGSLERWPPSTSYLRHFDI